MPGIMTDCFAEEKQCTGYKTEHDGWHRAHMTIQFSAEKPRYYCMACIIKWIEYMDDEYQSVYEELEEFREQRDMSMYR